MKERSAEIWQLIQQKANFYVCGDAHNMARQINSSLIQIIAAEKGVQESKAEEIVKSMRSRNVYQEDVWS